MIKLKRYLRSQLALAVLCLLPPLLLVALSFFQQWPYPQLIPGVFTTEAWSFIFDKQNEVIISILSGTGIAIVVALLATVFGFFTGMVIAYHPLRKYLVMLAYLPFVLSPVILAVCLKFYFIKFQIAGTITGVVLAQLMIVYPYAVIFFTGFWNNRIKEFIKLSQTLGSHPGQIFTRLVVPLAKPMLLVGFFQCFLISWFEYGLTFVIGYGKVHTLTIKLFQYITEANIFYSALCCSLLITPPVLLLWLNKKIIYHKLN